MSRTANIYFQRITLSFPEKVISDLREKIGQNNMSGYVAELVRKDLANKEMNGKEMVEFLRNFRKENKAISGKSSLEILREIRYGKKE